MVGLALDDPNPVLIFENTNLYNKKGDFDAKVPVLEIGKAFVHRKGKDITLLAYGVNVFKALEAADILAKDGIDAEVIDLRSLRPLDNETIMASIKKTHRAIIVDEDWKSGSISAEIMARINEEAFYELDAPMARVCSREIPFPYAAHLEQAAMPQVDKIVQTAHEVMES